MTTPADSRARTIARPAGAGERDRSAEIVAEALDAFRAMTPDERRDAIEAAAHRAEPRSRKPERTCRCAPTWCAFRHDAAEVRRG